VQRSLRIMRYARKIIINTNKARWHIYEIDLTVMQLATLQLALLVDGLTLAAADVIAVNSSCDGKG